MTFEEFEEAAHAMWAEIPDTYKDGIDGLVVKREAEAHEEHEDYWTLGMCYTEPYPSGYSAPDSTRSFLALFHGSFAKIADQSDDFDWEGEIWETITHELRHHLEFLASDDALEGVDYAMEEAFKRGEGEPFDPWYYQAGERAGPGLFQVEYDYYLERRWREGELSPGEEVEFEWEGLVYSVPLPEPLGDLHFVSVGGMPIGGSFQLVLVREAPFLQRIRQYFRKSALEILESEADAVPVPPATGDSR
jgi:hypothetical protein